VEHGDQDGRDGDSGRCLRSRWSWLDPVHALAVRGAARVRVSIPQPWRGRSQSARRKTMASSGRSSAVVQAAKERRKSGTDAGHGGPAVAVPGSSGNLWRR
jgi:hypothetical protein